MISMTRRMLRIEPHFIRLYVLRSIFISARTTTHGMLSVSSKTIVMQRFKKREKKQIYKIRVHTCVTRHRSIVKVFLFSVDLFNSIKGF